MLKTMQYLMFFCWLMLLSVSISSQSRGEYPRTNRGFKSQGLSTARGFGKRDPGLTFGQGTFVSGSNMAPRPQNTFENTLPFSLDPRSSYPNNWLIEEIQNNPEVARLIVEKVVDGNGDGELTPEELYRRINY